MANSKFEEIKDLVEEKPEEDVLNHECYVHKMRGNAAWWWEHIAEYTHEHSGVTTCKDCGKPEVGFVYVGKLYNRSLPPAYCEDCRK